MLIALIDTFNGLTQY